MSERAYLIKAAAVILAQRLHRATAPPAMRQDSHFGVTTRFDGAMVDMLSTVIPGECDAIHIFIFTLSNEPIIVEEWTVQSVVRGEWGRRAVMRSLYLLSACLRRLPDDCRFSLQSPPENAVCLEQAVSVSINDDNLEPFGTVSFASVTVRFRHKLPETLKTIDIVKPADTKQPMVSNSFESIHQPASQPTSTTQPSQHKEHHNLDDAAELTVFLRKLESRPLIVPGLNMSLPVGDQQEWTRVAERWRSLTQSSCTDLLDDL